MGQDPESLRQDIERTRLDVGRDVDALGEKLSPQAVIQRRARRTRTAVTNLRYRVMGTARHSADSVQERTSGTFSEVSDAASGATSRVSDTVSSAASTVEDVARRAPDTVRQRTEGNPLAAGLVAFGAGWLASSFVPPTSAEQQAAGRIRETAQEYAAPVKDQARQVAREVADELREPAKEAAEAVRSKATEGAQSVADHGKQAGSDVAGEARQAGSQVADQARR